MFQYDLAILNFFLSIMMTFNGDFPFVHSVTIEESPFILKYSNNMIPLANPSVYSRRCADRLWRGSTKGSPTVSQYHISHVYVCFSLFDKLIYYIQYIIYGLKK